MASNPFDVSGFYQSVYNGQVGVMNGALGAWNTAAATPAGQDPNHQGPLWDWLRSIGWKDPVEQKAPGATDILGVPFATGATQNPAEYVGGVASEIDLSSVTDWLTGTIGRVAIIVLGIVFVAVALSLFREPIVKAVTT